MSQTVYRNHPHIQRPLTFQGLHGPFLNAAAVGLPGLLLAFVVLYLQGLPLLPGACGLLAAGTGLYVKLKQMSQRYGALGLQKKHVRHRLPKCLSWRSRQLFFDLIHPNPHP